MGYRFSPAVRLRSRGEYTLVQNRGRRVATKYMTVLGRPNELDRDRLGIIASRRLGGAVTRNRAKRRLREVFRRQEPARPEGTVRPAFDLVVIPRRELVLVPMPIIEADFQSAVRRLRGTR